MIASGLHDVPGKPKVLLGLAVSVAHRDPGGSVRVVASPEAPTLEGKENLYTRSGQIRMTAITANKI